MPVNNPPFYGLQKGRRRLARGPLRTPGATSVGRSTFLSPGSRVNFNRGPVGGHHLDGDIHVHHAPSRFIETHSHGTRKGGWCKGKPGTPTILWTNPPREVAEKHTFLGYSAFFEGWFRRTEGTPKLSGLLGYFEMTQTVASLQPWRDCGKPKGSHQCDLWKIEDPNSHSIQALPQLKLPLPLPLVPQNKTGIQQTKGGWWWGSESFEFQLVAWFQSPLHKDNKHKFNYSKLGLAKSVMGTSKRAGFLNGLGYPHFVLFITPLLRWGGGLGSPHARKMGSGYQTIHPVLVSFRKQRPTTLQGSPKPTTNKLATMVFCLPGKMVPSKKDTPK